MSRKANYTRVCADLQHRRFRGLPRVVLITLGSWPCPLPLWVEMERSVGLSAVFLLLLPLWDSATAHCAKSLGYNFTVTPNGQPWCEIQGQVNGNTFLHYTCGSQEVKLFSVLEMNATQAWNQQRETLQDVVEELKKTLLDFKAEITATSGPLSLQGSMMCEQESNGLTSASWEFGLDGQICLRFDSKNRNGRELNNEGRLLKKTLAGDNYRTNLFNKTSVAECMKWLKEVLCPQDEILSTKDASTTAIATDPSKATTNTPIAWWIFLLIFTCVTIVGILVWVLYSNRLPMRCDQGGPGGVDHLSDSAFAWLPLDDLRLVVRTRGVQTSVQRPGSDQDERVEAASHVCYCIC
ncbi:PREDICTED: NKG2D ligand 1 isoform X2 [Myotis brandtii]|uniref:NKG2D ligand 1 isoform X2 n=1 Tax=Myotis brandtii TaxID=109478 RepID=UPI0007040D94|nr:PREDICTED: NKG2D ligand 1 isoform X2 [Myotis brandtii]